MKWEYMIKSNLNEETMNMYGEDGWELVSVAANRWGESVSMYFKRPIKEE